MNFSIDVSHANRCHKNLDDDSKHLYTSYYKMVVRRPAC